MKNKYIDYPEQYNENIINALHNEYKNKSVSLLSFLDNIKKENNMQHIKSSQNEPNNNTISETDQIQSQQNFRLYSLLSSNYCNLTNLFNNLISKTSSSKREYYQQINAQLKVDQETFNNTFNTICNMQSGSFCNYNQLVYSIIENFIELIENLSNLYFESNNSPNLLTVSNLKNNAFNLFKKFINIRPIRY